MLAVAGRGVLPAARAVSPQCVHVVVGLASVLVLVLALAPPLDEGYKTRVLVNRAITWSPPPCGDATHRCRDIYLADTRVNQTPSLSPSTDYRIHLPAYWPLVGGLQIRGGRNVQIIGGQIDLITPCDDSNAGCHGINIAKPSAGVVYIEGVYIRNPDPTHRKGTGDGIDVDLRPGTRSNDIVIQNVRVEGIAGCDPRNPASDADILQTYAAPDANIRIDNLTGSTDCQGLQLDPDLAWSRHRTTAQSQTLRNVNINVFPNPHSGRRNRYAIWLTYGHSHCRAAPTTLTNVWVKEPNPSFGTESTWPETNRPAGCSALWRPSARRTSFPGLRDVTGEIREGRPPGGDFVPIRGDVGLRYSRPRLR
jgi:hypothetical protein